GLTPTPDWTARSVRQGLRGDGSRADARPFPSHRKLDVSPPLEEQHLDRVASGRERDLPADLARAVQTVVVHHENVVDAERAPVVRPRGERVAAFSRAVDEASEAQPELGLARAWRRVDRGRRSLAHGLRRADAGQIAPGSLEDLVRETRRGLARAQGAQRTREREAADGDGVPAALAEERPRPDGRVAVDREGASVERIVERGLASVDGVVERRLGTVAGERDLRRPDRESPLGTDAGPRRPLDELAGGHRVVVRIRDERDGHDPDVLVVGERQPDAARCLLGREWASPG